MFNWSEVNLEKKHYIWKRDFRVLQMFLFHIREFLIAVKKYLNIHSNILIENIRSFTVSLYVKYEFTFALRSPHPANLASTSLQSFILQSHTYYIARKVDRICINLLRVNWKSTYRYDFWPQTTLIPCKSQKMINSLLF